MAGLLPYVIESGLSNKTYITEREAERIRKDFDELCQDWREEFKGASVFISSDDRTPGRNLYDIKNGSQYFWFRGRNTL
ncbi:MAG: hypothetical protein LBJ09_03735 [Clostridiales bacterium]|jgi:hypothetical protein|nr:hypothetical protein [Clostridiales bacterium]